MESCRQGIPTFCLTVISDEFNIRNMSNYETIEIDPTMLEQFTGMFKAMSNPHRLRILLELSRCSPAEGFFTADSEQVENCQQEFATSLGLAPSTVSHHFKELRQAGLLHMRREGKKVIVWVDKTALESIRQLLA